MLGACIQCWCECMHQDAVVIFEGRRCAAVRGVVGFESLHWNAVERHLGHVCAGVPHRPPHAALQCCIHCHRSPVIGWPVCQL